MRIFKKTDRTLTLWQNNWPSLGCTLILSSMFIPSFLFLTMNGEVKLTCYRATPLSGQCQIENNSLFNYQSQSITLDSIQKVDLEASNSEEEDALTRVLLIKKDGQTMPITLEGNAEERDQIAIQLATFLETPTASTLKITDGNLNFDYLIASVTGLGILAYLLSGGWTIAKFDKDKNECQVNTWSRKGKKIDRYALNHIEDVKLEIKSGWMEPKKHRIVLILEQGYEQTLSKRYAKSDLDYWRDTRNVWAITEFLNLSHHPLDSNH
jgi:hypothetical protein